MSELNQGTPSADNAVEVPVVDTTPPVEAPPQVASQPPPPTVPPKYAGKSADELARMLEAQEQHIGKQGQELGELRQKSQYQEQTLAQMQFMAQQQAQTAQTARPQVPDEPGKFNWEDPDTSVDKRVDRRLKTEREELRRQVVMEMAAFNAPIAKEMAKTKYPDAFKGVGDDELDRAMYGGAAAGNVQPQNLTKPEAWRMLGWILQGEKSGYKMPQPGVNPVSPTATETPMGAKPQNYGEEPIAIDDAARSIIKGFGADEASVLKSMRDEQRRR